MSYNYMMLGGTREFATLNPADKGTGIILSNGNLTFAGSEAEADWEAVRATIGKSSGKWYFEVTQTVNSYTHEIGVGVADSGFTLASYLGSNAQSAGYIDADGLGGFTCLSTGVTVTTTTRTGYVTTPLGFAFDATAKKVWIQYGNGLWLDGDPVAGTSPSMSAWAAATIYPAASVKHTPNATMNFGATAFSYAVPVGFNSGVYN